MKIFVEVNTPGNGKTYEFQLDSIMTVGQVKAKMIDEITEIESGNITLDHKNAMLSNLSTKARLSDSKTLTAAGIKSGHSLLLL
jgi:hypothetical protein